MKNQKQFKTYIGVDLGDRKHQICVTDKEGTILSEQKIENTREDLAQLANENSEALLLQSIPSIGEITSLSFILIIEDVKRFDGPRDVGAFLGLVPKRNQSGDTDKQLSITKAGNKMLRRLLVQCAQYQLGAHAPDSALRDWGLNYMVSGGSRAKKKAIVAVARKLAVLMVTMLKTGEQYEPYPNEKPDLVIESKQAA